VMITTNLVFSEWERIFKDPMTTMAAIDRLVHHSIILDMMSVESYRAEVASLQHLSSARPKKSSSRHASHNETVVSLQGSDASSGVTSPSARKTTPASLLVPDATPAPLLVAENASGDPFSVDITSAHLIATNGTV
jgi:IstB-like ATP binding protein